MPSIDKGEATKLGKLTVPFMLAIFLALALEDWYGSLDLRERIILFFGLSILLVLIYPKKVRSYLD